MDKRLFLNATVFFLIVIGLLPLLSMLEKSLFVDGHFTLASYRTVLNSSRQWTLMQHSLLLSGLVTIFSVTVGVALGIVLGKTDLPFRRFFTILFAIPLMIPPYIIAVAWSDFLGTKGPAALVMGDVTLIELNRLLFALPGNTFVLFTVFLPIPMLLTIVSLRSVNPRLEEAARLTTSWRGTLSGITLPLIFPAIILSALLVFLLVFGEFTVANYLRYSVYPVESFTRFSAFYDFAAGTAAAMPLLAVTLLLLWAESAFLRDKTSQLRPSVAPKRVLPIALGRWRSWLLAAVTVIGILLVILPIMTLLLESAGPENYREAFARAGGSLGRSILYAVIGATLLTLLGFFTGYLIQHRALRYWRMVDTVTIFLFTLPATVIGIGLISLWNTPWTNLIYSTPAIILLGYLAKYTALSSRITAAQLTQISPSMEEAAQMAGAGWFRTVFLILVPLARNGLMAAWLVGYIFTMRDSSITMMVYPAGYETLPVRIFTLMANGSPELIAALCILMIAATLLPVALIWIFYRYTTSKAAL